MYSMSHREDAKKANEILHGIKLAKADPESIWGWGTPAGRLRALRRAKLIAEAVDARSQRRILEIGCGTGYFTEFFAQSGCKEIVAVDISQELLDRATQRNLPPDKVQFVNIAFEQLDETDLFDTVIGSSILHHLPLDESLEKIFRILRHGGSLCFAEPNMLNPQIFLQKNIPWLKRLMGDSPDETAFVRWPLAQSLMSAGFVEVSIQPFDWLHPATPIALIGLVSAVGSFLERVPGVREFAGSLCIAAKKP